MVGRFDDRATQPRRGPGDMLRWKVLDTLAGRRSLAVEPFTPPVRANDGAALRALEASLTWIGHASFLLRLGGKVVALDPIFSERIGGAVKRLAPPGVALEQAPPIDVVTVSHAHYDHLDLPSLKRIGPEATYVVPLGTKPLLEKAGLPKVIELDWWESAEVAGLHITFVPARHWSMRVPWDRNDALWGGFVIAGPEGRAYHSGDTAMFPGFAEIGERAGPIDWAMLPIGAYEPRWFMSAQHVAPEEAGEAFVALRAQVMVAMHWATFRLTDEPLAEPAQRIQTFFRERGLDPARLWLMDIGETRALHHTSPAAGLAPARPR